MLGLLPTNNTPPSISGGGREHPNRLSHCIQHLRLILHHVWAIIFVANARLVTLAGGLIPTGNLNVSVATLQWIFSAPLEHYG
jgi:hypothetical protein